MKPADVAIVGGGILGASVAYHLGAFGMHKIVLLERLEIAHAASCRAAGLVLQISSKPAVDRLCRTTLGVIGELEERLGTALDFHRVGTLRLAETAAGRSHLAGLLDRAQPEGISAQQVDAAWCAKKLPWLNVDPQALTAFFAEEGFIDPYRLTTAYVRAARQNGMRVDTGVAVRAIRLDRDGVTGLETSRGFQPCAAVVVAAGAWSNNLTAPLGVALPTVPTRSHFWVTASDPLFAGNQPMTILIDAQAYTRPELGGLLIGIQEQNSRTFDFRALPDDIRTFPITDQGAQWDVLVESAARLATIFPAINDISFASHVDGLSNYTPDGHFVVGPIEAIPGLYVAAGCCGSGVMASGGIGDAVARLILQKDIPYDLAPFRPERFGRVEPASTEFRVRCAAARAAKVD